MTQYLNYVILNKNQEFWGTAETKCAMPLCPSILEAVRVRTQYVKGACLKQTFFIFQLLFTFVHLTLPPPSLPARAPTCLGGRGYSPHLFWRREEGPAGASFCF